MISPFSFDGRIGRFAYARWSLGVFFSQHLAVFLAFKVLGQTLDMNYWFYFVPLRSLVSLAYKSDLILIAALAYLLIAAWALAALSFRRAADAGVDEWLGVPAILQFIQVPVILFLCIAPSSRKDARMRSDALPIATGFGWAAAAQGTIAGMGLTLVAVAVAALVFGAYGFGMFVVSLFVIGAMTAYFANRKADVGALRTAFLVFGAAVAGGIALIIAALEGAVCLVVASPLGIGVALIGGLLGRSAARHGRRPTKHVLSVVALLPIVFACENALPATTTFDTYQTIEVDAPSGAVWQAIVQMEEMDESLALPFRLGVAYPIRGEIIGEGVGAVRRGEFSTGATLECVTEWVRDRKLAFTILKDVPAMRELSPYHHVHSPHVEGYFLTKGTSFELVAGVDHRTEIIERTSHELKLEPILYWLPIARWIVDQNNGRVLAHIKRQAERNAGTVGWLSDQYGANRSPPS
jgi:uncharacterized membrane protein YhaH (DUF805 family)